MNTNTDDKLIQMVTHAYNTVPFYQNIIKDMSIDLSTFTKTDFNKLPLIDKKIILDSNMEMISKKYENYSSRKDMLIRRTSGSSGHYLKVYWNKYDNIRSLLGLWYRRKYFYGISPTDKYCYFYTTDYVANKFVECKDTTIALNYRSIGFSKLNLDRKRIKEIYNKMIEFEPVWLMMQPSIALLFCSIIRDDNLKVINSIRYIELTGEFLTQTVRREIEDTFGCTVSNQYGCNEANSIASDCCNKQLHIHSSNVFIEILKDGKEVPYGTEGDIYITSLENKVMPFIRYKIGEKGILHDSKKCKCGCTEKILELLNGRECSTIIAEDNTRIPSYIFLRPIEYINEKIGNIIRQFQVIQHDINDFSVKLVIKPSYTNWKDTIKSIFLEELKERALCNAKWRFIYTQELFPDNNTGKLAYFINEINENMR